jgi:hypothetical protein
MFANCSSIAGQFSEQPTLWFLIFSYKYYKAIKIWLELLTIEYGNSKIVRKCFFAPTKVILLTKIMPAGHLALGRKYNAGGSDVCSIVNFLGIVRDS